MSTLTVSDVMRLSPVIPVITIDQSPAVVGCRVILHSSCSVTMRAWSLSNPC